LQFPVAEKYKIMFLPQPLLVCAVKDKRVFGNRKGKKSAGRQKSFEFVKKQ